jgi:hypothetical protein
MRETSSAVKCLLLILNLNGSAGDGKAIKEILWQWHLEAGELQAIAMELRQDLAFLLSSRSNPMPALHDLVEKLNDWAMSGGPEGVGINPQWHVWTDKKAVALSGQAPATIFKLAGGKHVIERRLVPHGFRDMAYICVAECLETGDLGRLRECQTCKRIFFAASLKMEYCSPDCYRQHDRITAAARVRASRTRKKKRQKRVGLPVLVRLANSGISEIRKTFGERFDDFLPYAERVRRGEKPGWVWRALPARFKKLVAADLA